MTDKTPAMTELPDGATVLPDGSAFAIASFPLPANHWLYAPREYRDGEEDPIELPSPILSHQAHGDVVRAAIRYAVRGATMCGKEPDFDPDALVQNAMYALCGPFGGAALQSAQPSAAVSDEAARLAEQLSNIANGVRICGVHDRHFVSNRLHEIARAILALRPAQHAPEWDGGEPANLQAAARDADEWLALIQRLNDAGRWLFSQPDSRPKLDGCRAALSKILCAPAQQAVPMTDEQVDRIWNALPMGNGFWLSFARAVEAHHGITQRADGGEKQA